MNEKGEISAVKVNKPESISSVADGVMVSTNVVKVFEMVSTIVVNEGTSGALVGSELNAVGSELNAEVGTSVVKNEGAMLEGPKVSVEMIVMVSMIVVRSLLGETVLDSSGASVLVLTSRVAGGNGVPTIVEITSISVVPVAAIGSMFWVPVSLGVPVTWEVTTSMAVVSVAGIGPIIWVSVSIGAPVAGIVTTSSVVSLAGMGRRL